jgi:hypothetical protein
MNRIYIILLIILFTGGCGKNNNTSKRVTVATAGNTVLYLDQIPPLIQPGTPEADSTSIIQNYINKWAKKELLFQKAEENLSPMRLTNSLKRRGRTL